MKKFVLVSLLISQVTVGYCDCFEVGDIKVRCNCGEKDTKNSWIIDHIEPDWIEKLKINPPQIIAINLESKSYDGALGETRTPMS